ncbi:MAG: hypothetical protein FWF29_02000, partial [Treponema sp.]|nr:hypothetical protein [Treponema sp.]
MKKQRWAFYGCAALAAALFVLTFASCPTVSDNGNKINNGPKVVDGLDMTPLVPYPVGGTAVENAIDEQPEFTGTVAWEQIYGGGSLAFPEYGLNYTTGLDYRATVALTAKDGYTFKGAAADSFTHQYGGITNPAGDGNTLTLTIVFPKAPDANDQQVSATNLFESLPAPYRGGAPAASIDNSQYSGIVNWSTDSGTFTGAVFDPATIYTAKITLDTYGGYTLFGLSSHSFSHPLAQTVSFDAATDTVTVRFNKTAGLTEDSVVNLFNLSDSVKWPGQNETLTSTFENDQYTANVAWFNSSGGAISAVPASNFKAVVSMTAKTGFTFAGVAANSFFHSAKGVSSVSNDADGATA